MEVIDLQTFLKDGMFRETVFREAIQKYSWDQYAGKPVVIQGCGEIELPTWSYLCVVAELIPYASRIFYGEPRRPIPIWKKPGEPAETNT